MFCVWRIDSFIKWGQCITSGKMGRNGNIRGGLCGFHGIYIERDMLIVCRVFNHTNPFAKQNDWEHMRS